jgi:hypothetical protein
LPKNAELLADTATDALSLDDPFLWSKVARELAEAKDVCNPDKAPFREPSPEILLVTAASLDTSRCCLGARSASISFVTRLSISRPEPIPVAVNAMRATFFAILTKT